MTYTYKGYGLIISCLMLSACSVNLADYAERTPKLNFAQFFDGKLCAKGLLKQSNGMLTRTFVADIVATGDNQQVMLDEKFLFDDGEQQTRIWQFKSNQSGQWVGTAGDVVGDAIGQIAGDTMRLDYRLAIQVDGTERIVNMEDWLHLVDQNTLIGTTQITKWGIDFGRIDIVISKQAASVSSCFSKQDEVYEI